MIGMLEMTRRSSSTVVSIANTDFYNKKVTPNKNGNSNTIINSG